MKKRDHLPFSNLIFKIAQSLPNAPTKPKLTISLNIEYFLIFFLIYINI